MAKQKKRIVITGAHGVGKTTLMNALAKDNIRTITQVSRNVISENNFDHSENTTTECQKTIFKELKKALSSKRSYISDRGLSCVAAYTFNKALTNDIPKKVADKQYLDLEKFHKDNPDILVVYVPIEFPLVDDGVRSVDPKFQEEIDFLVKNILETTKIPYITVTGTVEERVAQVEDALKNMV